MSTNKDLEKWFPNIIGKPYKTTISNFNFNCVAYTLDVYNDYIWTNEKSWPHNIIPRILNINSFKKLYEINGYEECYDEIFDLKYNKVAFYAKNGIPIHAAKRYKNIWKSKISNLIVEHELDWLCGDYIDTYGEVVFLMRKLK